ncbi:hypothetical protein DICVIV_05421 [Dictyocaulus viviparus]|uniref:Purple acid phosphatase C-terminal domain-containing protein n=1 Tax=Dictyocaulus viviparus TaxID=29172 RepID=A0A0D8Y1H3_DICVI|nr:hypothetical protein DICVIV_05421 [Dictyocaulus viviparus]
MIIKKISFKPTKLMRINDYGYSILTVANATHIHVEQISIEKNESVVDDLWIMKDIEHTHTSYMRFDISINKLTLLHD